LENDLPLGETGTRLTSTVSYIRTGEPKSLIHQHKGSNVIDQTMNIAESYNERFHGGEDMYDLLHEAYEHCASFKYNDKNKIRGGKDKYRPRVHGLILCSLYALDFGQTDTFTISFEDGSLFECQRKNGELTCKVGTTKEAAIRSRKSSTRSRVQFVGNSLSTC